MTNNADQEILEAARDYFKNDNYSQAEPLLNQLILKGQKPAEVFHMLGTIYYDQGKFSKAIRLFKRALEVDPSYTDASIGLSIILNDLGRYQEGQKVFEEAQVMLAKNKSQHDPYINEKLAIKHDELGELYMQFNRPQEAIDQYYKALNLSSRTPELTMKIVDAYESIDESEKALKTVQTLVKQYPGFLKAKLKLGQMLLAKGEVVAAIEQWEGILAREENHPEALRMLKQAQHPMKSYQTLTKEFDL